MPVSYTHLNLTYRKPELLEREWYYDVDVSKYLSLIHI